MTNRKKTHENFMAEIRGIFGDIYDYSNSIYNGSDQQIKIICKIHDEFSQLAKSHLKGYGCRKCADERRTHSTDEFIAAAMMVFGNKYDYSCVAYKSSMLKVEIICTNHGKFYQRPHDHLSGYGCAKCKAETISLKCRSTLDEFINKANDIHNNKYDYSESIYKNSLIKINIICPSHGKFWQTPSNHISGHGCPKCVSSISQLEIEWLNTLGIDEKFRHQSIRINGKVIKVDAFNPNTNTIYEFYGDYWHGNPARFSPDTLNETNKKTHGELYKNTMDREKMIKNAGYNMVSVWEKDFNKTG